MDATAKILIILGVVFVAAGLAWHFGLRPPALGRLPGDIVVERENFRFYLPLGTSLLLSLVLSLLVWLFRIFSGR